MTPTTSEASKQAARIGRRFGSLQGRTNTIGTALMTVGGILLATLFGSAASSGQAIDHFWHRSWFVLLVVIFGLVVLIGFYVILAGEIRWIPPERWTREETAAPLGRIGYRGRPGSKGNLRGTKFGSGLDTAIDNEGDLNAEDSTIE